MSEVPLQCNSGGKEINNGALMRYLGFHPRGCRVCPPHEAVSEQDLARGRVHSSLVWVVYEPSTLTISN